jgi:hypothetical protein
MISINVFPPLRFALTGFVPGLAIATVLLVPDGSNNDVFDVLQKGTLLMSVDIPGCSLVTPEQGRCILLLPPTTVTAVSTRTSK